jgi:acetylornithine aminotransferase
VSCSAALAVIDTIEKDELLAHVSSLGAAWADALGSAGGDLVRGVRGRGLWLALAVDDGVAPLAETSARAHGFIVNAVAPDAIRLAPPLVLTHDEAMLFTDALPAILRDAATVSAVPAEEGRP